MLRFFLGAAFLIVLPSSAQEGPAPWEVATPAGYFLKAESLDLSFLPPPPVEGSLAAQADLEAVLQSQAWRTPTVEAWAKSIENDTVWKFAPEIGPWFMAENLPKTARLFWQLTVDTHAISEQTKGRFRRVRPFIVDSRIHPCVAKPSNDSYPSGHAIQAFVRAAVLAELCPERREALFARAHRAAWGRIQGGVHYPTDVVGGRVLAEAIVIKLRGNPDFRVAIEACRAEIGMFSMKKAG